jgi:hypothetical protein
MSVQQPSTEACAHPDIDTLAIIADWRVDLGARIRRAELRQELIGLDPKEIGALGDEAKEFSRVCKVIKGLGHYDP